MSGINYFSPSDFDFVTTIADSGKGKGGGWQEAVAKLKIRRWTGWGPEAWTCNVTVGTPLRSAANGKISPELAAEISADVATEATGFINSNTPDLPPGIYCSKLKETMNIMIGKALSGALVYTK